jgi:hypothetical protein
MKELYDEQFENYLREFRPKRPRALPPLVETKDLWRRFAAAAGILIVVGASTWFATHQRRSAEVERRRYRESKARGGRLSLLSLTHIAVEDPVRLEAVLAQESVKILPDFRNKDSTLRVLAKE